MWLTGHFPIFVVFSCHLPILAFFFVIFESNRPPNLTKAWRLFIWPMTSILDQCRFGGQSLEVGGIFLSFSSERRVWNTTKQSRIEEVLFLKGEALEFEFQLFMILLAKLCNQKKPTLSQKKSWNLPMTHPEAVITCTAEAINELRRRPCILVPELWNLTFFSECCQFLSKKKHHTASQHYYRTCRKLGDFC